MDVQYLSLTTFITLLSVIFQIPQTLWHQQGFSLMSGPVAYMLISKTMHFAELLKDDVKIIKE